MASVVPEIVKASLLTFGALFPIVNPLGNAPIFLVLTRGIPSDLRAMPARKVAALRRGPRA